MYNTNIYINQIKYNMNVYYCSGILCFIICCKEVYVRSHCFSSPVSCVLGWVIPDSDQKYYIMVD